MTTATVELRGLIRLWDEHLNLIATEVVTTWPSQNVNAIKVQVRGKGPLYDAVRRTMPDLATTTMHVTFDPNHANPDWHHRLGGIVTRIEIDEHRCECGTLITVTTVHATHPNLPAVGPIAAARAYAVIERLQNRRSGG